MRQLAVMLGIVPVLLVTPIAWSAEGPPQSEVPPQSKVEIVAPDVAGAILGQRVSDQDGKDIGRLVDVLVDANGQPQAAVIDFGGFLGVGNRKVAVHWQALRFTPADPKHKITLSMTPEQIKAVPEFRDLNKPVPVVTGIDPVVKSP
jgi:hypothetical protein